MFICPLRERTHTCINQLINSSASYLDLLLPIGRDGQLHTSLCDKRDDLNFHITNFPFLSSNIPSSLAYGGFISQLFRYARACSSYECFFFILRVVRHSNKLPWQGYVKERLRSSLRTFYGRYGNLIKQYEVPLSRMLHNILNDDHIQWHPQSNSHNINFWPFYWSGPYHRIWLLTYLREVSLEHLHRCGMATDDAYSSGHYTFIAQFGGRHEDLSHPENSCRPRAKPEGDMNFLGGTNLLVSRLTRQLIVYYIESWSTTLELCAVRHDRETRRLEGNTTICSPSTWLL